MQLLNPLIRPIPSIRIAAHIILRQVSNRAEAKNTKPEPCADDGLEKAKKDPKDVGEKKSPSQVDRYEPPVEDRAVPKRSTFIQLQKHRNSEVIYTLEEAAAYRKPENLRTYFKYPALAQNTGYLNHALRSYENLYTTVSQFPDSTDTLIVGAGLMGCSAAYYIKYLFGTSLDVTVIDKDPYGPHNCTAFSNGLITTQSKDEDIIRVAQLSKELIRCLRNDVLCTAEDFAKINYRPVSHLVFYREDQVDEALEAVTLQCKNGCYSEALFCEDIEKRYPFLCLDDLDIAFGVTGNQDEALVDPIALRNLYRVLAQGHGANFIKGEALDFNTVHRMDQSEIVDTPFGAMVVKVDSGELRHVTYAGTMLCLGHNTPFLEARAEMEGYHRDIFDDLHYLQPKMRLVFTFNSLEAPVINFPVITELDGSQLICESFSGTFKYYLNLDESEEIFDSDCDKYMDVEAGEPYPNLFHTTEDLEVYFNETVKPRLVNRVPAMQDAKFLFAQSGFESWNVQDGNPIMSIHPHFTHIFMAGGYGNRMMNFAPLAGIALTERLIFNDYDLFDITRLHGDRVLRGIRLKEFPQLIGGFEHP